MAQTKIKAGLFEGIIGNGTDGYFLMSNGDGTMAWSSIIINPTISSIAYPGSVTAADPVGGETITVTGTGFKTGATVTIGGTAAPAVSYVSDTQITFTTPAKAAGDYDIVVTNTDTGSATFINGISYNGIPTWTTAAGSLGTFASDTTISTITLQATEPDAGTITFSITNGALPTGLSLTGADIDGTTSKETADTLYNFTVTAIDDENQSTPRAFSITVEKWVVPAPENFEIVTYTGNGGTQAITSKIGKAASFNGSSSKIDIPTITISSVSFWVYLNNFSSTHAIFGSSSDTSKYLYIQTNGTVLINTQTTITPSTSIQSGTWEHIAFTESGGTVTMYLNGQSVGSVSSTLGGWNQFGARTSGTAVYLDGKLDQIRIFNTALNSTKVGQLADEEYGDAENSVTDFFGDGSGVALYELDEDANDTGGTYNGTATNVNYLGMAFQPDLVWIKNRFGYGHNHNLIDSVRGASSKLFSNLTNAEVSTGGLASFDSNGFSFDSSSGNDINEINFDFVAWCWKAGGAAVSNTDGSITSSVSANPDAGFSIVTYTKSGTTGTMGHGLTAAPELIIEKRRDGAAYWNVRVEGVTANNQTIYLNQTTEVSTHPSLNLWSTPTTSVFGYDSANATAGNYVAYCFHSVDSYQKVGSYTGTGSAVTVTTGFRPRFVIQKAASTGGDWAMYDSVRGGDKILFPYLSNAELNDSNYGVTFNSNGFTINSGYSANGTTYIYLAIA